MARYLPEPPFDHGALAAVGVLAANLGTPEAPTPAALRRYLRQFLSDPRVIELPRWKWLPILYLFVLTTRPKTSAALYRKVWTAEGSPLLLFSRRLAAALEETLRRQVGEPLRVALGMRYGRPSIAAALGELKGAGCRRLLVLPLYPQYSATTTAATFDAVAAELTRWRFVPELRTIHSYHDDPGYVAALAASIREVWERDGEPDKLLFSFHGLPRRYFDAGDPYHCLCQGTARLVAAALALPQERYGVAFQSRFGREEWLGPATIDTVREEARAGRKRLDVVCPGFAADCLETLEEIDQLNRAAFLAAGGERFRYLPALNDRPDHVRALAALAGRHLAGWTTPAAAWDEARARAAAAATRRRAEALAAAAPSATRGG
jgi:protoporphyrin/coproporphyrin ferrochelatase